MFSNLLDAADARRATHVVEAVLAHGLPCALAGGLARAARLRAVGLHFPPRPLNDIDLVVPGFSDIPASLAASFLVNHVHPYAAPGKTLLQLIDERRAVRVDLFRAFGRTLSRATTLEEDAGALPVIAMDDLVARATAMVCGQLQRGQAIDGKHAEAFAVLRRWQGELSEAAWTDHREDVAGTLDEAIAETTRLLQAHPELVAGEEYSTVITPCDRCREHGPFRPCPPERIVEILGYW